MLTQGLPHDWHSFLISSTLQTPEQWISMALTLESNMRAKDINRRQYRSSLDSDPCTHSTFTRPHLSSCSIANPQFPCRHCRELGTTEYHWYADCPHRPNRYKSSYHNHISGSYYNSHNRPTAPKHIYEPSLNSKPTSHTGLAPQHYDDHQTHTLRTSSSARFVHIKVKLNGTPTTGYVDSFSDLSVIN